MACLAEAQRRSAGTIDDALKQSNKRWRPIPTNSFAGPETLRLRGELRLNMGKTRN